MNRYDYLNEQKRKKKSLTKGISCGDVWQNKKNGQVIVTVERVGKDKGLDTIWKIAFGTFDGNQYAEITVNKLFEDYDNITYKGAIKRGDVF